MEQRELCKLKAAEIPNELVLEELKECKLQECPASLSIDPGAEPSSNNHHSSARTLKIEADGDPWKGLVKPKIRLMGRWLERAGFRPGERVHVDCISPGRIELRSVEWRPAAIAIPKEPVT